MIAIYIIGALGALLATFLIFVGALIRAADQTPEGARSAPLPPLNNPNDVVADDSRLHVGVRQSASVV